MSNFTLARVRLVWTEAEAREEQIEGQLLVDLYVDEDGRPSRQHPAFGVYGSPIGQGMYPFVIKTDGLVDFGEGLSPASRYGRCPIHERSISIGEFVSFEESADGEWTAKIIAVDR